jgi:hypothetical protein
MKKLLLITAALCSTAALAAPGGKKLPTVAFTAPAEGGTLSGNVQGPPHCVVEGSNIVRVEFYLDGVWTNTDGNTANGLGCWIDTVKHANGAHTVKAVAYNSAGQSASAARSIVIDNPAPSVSFVQPVSGQQISSSSACEVTGTSIGKVDFALWDAGGVSTALGTDSAAPWSCSIDTARFADGDYTLMATASNFGGSATAQVAVKIAKPAGGDPAAAAIDPADIMGQAQAEVPFVQQSGFNTQVLAQYLFAPEIPETGMHAFSLSNGETLRFGKHADPLNSARKALAFQVDPNDVTTSGAKRAELKFANNIQMDRVYWAAMSVYVYDWGTLSTADDALFGLQQHNGSPADLSPNFALITSGTGRTFQVMALGSSDPKPTYANTVSFKYAEQPIPFGRWADFVFKFKLNTSGDGFLQVWMDGTQIVEHRGLLGYITPGYLDFFKFGYYNWSGSSFASTRKVLVRSPVVVADPTGVKYKPEDLRAYVSAR